MKKIFCDCCGAQFDYGDAAVKTASYIAANLKWPRVMGGAKIEVEVVISVQPISNSNGGHLDLCGICRWKIIDSVDPRPLTAADATKTGKVYAGQDRGLLAGDRDG